MTRTLVLLGPPGAGKGTQGARMAQRLGVPKISTGEIFRDLAAAGTRLGLLAKTYWSSGQLVPDDIVAGLVRERTAAADCESGFILDGFPRTVTQAEILDCLLMQTGRQLVCAITFDVTEEELIRRLSGRRTCSHCSATYHVSAMPPRIADVCDYCASPLTARPDDCPDSIRIRLQEYGAKTAPLLAHYAERKLLKRVDASHEPDRIYWRLETLLAELWPAATVSNRA